MEEFNKDDSKELIDEITRLRKHVAQLQNTIVKLQNPIIDKKGGKQRNFDFSKHNVRHVALKLLYLGWDYDGFASQEDTSKTIEAALFDALYKTKLISSRQTSNYHRCGRTDKGVSAFSQVISIDLRTNMKHGPSVKKSIITDVIDASVKSQNISIVDNTSNDNIKHLIENKRFKCDSSLKLESLTSKSLYISDSECDFDSKYHTTSSNITFKMSAPELNNTNIILDSSNGEDRIKILHSSAKCNIEEGISSITDTNANKNSFVIEDKLSCRNNSSVMVEPLHSIGKYNSNPNANILLNDSHIEVYCSDNNAMNVISDTQDLNDSEVPYVRMLNKVLPDDIRIIAWAPVDANFSARFNCIQRTYKYYIPASDLNIELMQKAGNYLIGEHDFRNLCKMDVNNGVVNYKRKIVSVQLQKSNNCSHHDSYDIIEVTIVGLAFLWHQIRCIISLLILVGKRLESSEIVLELLDVEKNPRKPQYTMAADFPLVLLDCQYKSINWIYKAEDLQDAVKALQSKWTCFSVRSRMVKNMLENLEEKLDHFSTYQINLLLPSLNQKNYKPLLEREKCESLDDRIKKCTKRKKAFKKYNNNGKFNDKF